MGALALLLVLAAPPPAARAGELAGAGQWEALYLAFASAPPAAYGPAERAKVGVALARGCEALLGDDWVLAYSLGERAVAFAPSAAGLYCTGLTALRTDQRAEAEESFRAGLRRYPKDFRFPLELGRLLALEGDAAGARAMFARVPRRAPEFAEAQAALGRLRAAEGDAPAAGGLAGAGQRGGDAATEARPAQGRVGPPRSTGSQAYQSGVDDEGRRTRSNQYFRFRAFDARRDFGERAEFEGQVQAALEEARRASERLLGVARTTPTDVILYSRSEFELHHGPQAARAIAGFYSASAIRVNDSAEMNPQNQATLVHEYVHAVVDEVSGFSPGAVPVWLNEGLAELTEWRYQGHEVPPLGLARAIRQLALGDRLPPLSGMSQGPLISSGNPALAYALSALAVKSMVARRGVHEVVALIRDCGGGMAFATAWERRYGGSLEDFERELQSELKH